MSLKNWTLACAASAGLCCFSTAAFAQVTGKVVLDGEPPQRATINMAANAQCAAAHANPVLEETVIVGDNKELANVVVSIKDDEGKLKGPAPKEPVKIDQKGCMYTPHVVAMMSGQSLVFTNSDPFLHNVHGLPIDNAPFNFAQPNVDKAGKAVNPSPKVPERFSVKCDVHPWMLSHVNVFEHPYFAVTNEKGEFTIPKGLPDGNYTLVFWHEKWGEQEGPEVEVKGGAGKLEEDFSYKQEAAAAPAKVAPVLTVKLASADNTAAVQAAAKDAKAGAGCADGSCCSASPSKAAAVAKADSQAKAK